MSTLYLIPSLLSEDAVDCIPSYLLDAVKSCKVIFAENERTTRRFLKKLDKSIVIDHHAWDYNDPKLRIGLRSLQNECALYRNRGYQYMYFESVEPYMSSIQGFEILGTL